jgi:transglutaminase-like putative cysteine protease
VGVDASQRAVALYRAVRDGFRYDPHQRHGYTEMWLGGTWCRATPAGAFDADVRRENAGGAEGSRKVRA